MEYEKEQIKDIQDLVILILNDYKRIYDTEEITMEVLKENPIMYNRGFSNGIFGIWGHDIGDLLLHTLCVKVILDEKNKFNQRIKIQLHVDS